MYSIVSLIPYIFVINFYCKTVNNYRSLDSLPPKIEKQKEPKNKRRNLEACLLEIIVRKKVLGDRD